MNIVTSLEKLLFDTHESLYWMGFIMADGCFYDNRLKVALSEKDEGHIFKLADYLNIKNREKYKLKGKYYYRIQARDKNNINKLKEKFNILDRKTYNPPNKNIFNTLEDKKILSFLIGFIDGDGCILKNSKRDNSFYISIEVHKSWLEILSFFQELLIKITGVNIPSIKITKNNKYCRLRIFNNEVIFLLKKHLKEVGIPYLNRKWDFIDENIKTQLNKSKEIIIKLLSVDPNKTVSEIAKYLNISYNKAYYFVKKYRYDLLSKN